jgi:hypothetical protein
MAVLGVAGSLPGGAWAQVEGCRESRRNGNFRGVLNLSGSKAPNGSWADLSMGVSSIAATDTVHASNFEFGSRAEHGAGSGRPIASISIFMSAKDEAPAYFLAIAPQIGRIGDMRAEREMQAAGIRFAVQVDLNLPIHEGKFLQSWVAPIEPSVRRQLREGKDLRVFVLFGRDILGYRSIPLAGYAQVVDAMMEDARTASTRSASLGCMERRPLLSGDRPLRRDPPS